MQGDLDPPFSSRARRSWIWGRVLRSGVVVIALLGIEYFVVPRLIGATKNLDLLTDLNVGWLVSAIALEAASLVCWTLLTRVLLDGTGPTFSQQMRITLATTAVSHVVPVSGAGTAGLGYYLLTRYGVDGPRAGFVLIAEAVGSAVTLITLLWLALLASIPVAGLRPIYAFVVVIGLLAILAVAALGYAFTRGEELAIRLVRRLGQRIPRLGADRLERLVRTTSDSLIHLARDRRLLGRATFWAALNWLLDAASLWFFVAAFGDWVNPIEVFIAYGIANVLAAVPITPAGLGVIEVSAVALLVGFGLTSVVATLAVLSWRVLNFWLPIPVGAVAYLSLGVRRRSTGTGND